MPDSRGKSFLLLLVSSAVALLLAEAALRILGVGYPGFHTMDPHLGITLLPGAQGWYEREGHAFVKINSHGLRDREHSLEKPDGVYRIAVLGDSYAEALQVPAEKAFWAVLEQELGQCAKFKDRTVEVVNFGVSGYGTAQELLVLRNRVWDYSPDMVLLAVLTGNDIRNNLRKLQKDPMRPYIELTEDGLRLDDSFLQSSGYRMRTSAIGELRHSLLASSRVVQVINEVKNRIWTQMKVQKRVDASEKVVDQFHADQGGGELGLDDMVYFEPTDPVWREAWDVTEALLVHMNKEVDGRADFTVVVLSNPMQVHPSREQRQSYMKNLGVNNLFYPDRRIARLGRLHGIQVIPLAERLASYASENNTYLHGFDNTTLGEGHWNETGHGMAGQYLAADICGQAGRIAAD